MSFASQTVRARRISQRFASGGNVTLVRLLTPVSSGPYPRRALRVARSRPALSPCVRAQLAAMGKSKGTGKAGTQGKVADKNATIQLPGGKVVKMKNSPTGFMVSGAHYLQCAEGGGRINPYDGQMEDGVGYGRRANNLPEKLWVSQNHGVPSHLASRRRPIPAS